MMFDDMTDDQLWRLYGRAWERINRKSREGGYERLKRAVAWLRHIDPIRTEIHRRMDAGIWSAGYKGARSAHG
jgi:hypothetical protein